MRLGDKPKRLNAVWREKHLQCTWLRTLQGRHEFRQVTGDALDFAMETLSITDGALRERLMDPNYKRIIFCNVILESAWPD
jgi:2-haloacid dehalogenase